MHTFNDVKRHRLLGRVFRFKVINVFTNSDTGLTLVKLKNPDGSTQIRRYYKKVLSKNIDLDSAVGLSS